MKIALLHPAFGAWGGAENMLVWLAGGLRERGHEVTVFCGAASPRAHQLFEGLRVPLHVLRGMHGRFWTRLQLRFQRGLPRFSLAPLADHVVRLDRRAMRAAAGELAQALQAFDVVNVHNYPATWWLAAARQAFPDVPPTLWYCQEPPRNLYAGLFDDAAFTFVADDSELQANDRQVGQSLTRICCNGDYVQARVAAIYQRKDVLRLHPGLPLEAYLAVERPAAIVPADLPGPQALRLLVVSRLVEAKNLDTVLAAVARVPGVHLTVVGTGPDRSRLQDLARTLTMEERVEWAGFVADEHLPRCYAQADLFAYLPLGEPFGLTLVEAAAAGLPALASDHGGPAEIVVPEETGWLVPPKDVEAVAEVLRRCAEPTSGRQLLRRAGEQARQRARNCFALETYLRGMEGLLLELAQAGHRL